MKKIITIITLFILLVGSVFAEDWMLRGTYNNEVAGNYKVYWDAESETPWIDSAKTFSSLFAWYQKALEDEKLLYNVYSKNEVEKENFWCLAASKKGYYHTMEVYEAGYAIHNFTCNNGTVIEIIIDGRKGD